MINRKKEEITEKVKELLPASVREQPYMWWMTGRQEGMRLTEYGDFCFRTAEIEFYEFTLTQKKQSWYNFLLELNNKINCPYYLGVNRTDDSKKKTILRIYDSKIAMMIGLFGSDVEDYLRSLKAKRK